MICLLPLLSRPASPRLWQIVFSRMVKDLQGLPEVLFPVDDLLGGIDL